LSLWKNGNIKKLIDQGGSPAYNLALVAKGSHSHFVMHCTKQPGLEDYSAPVLLVRNSGGLVTDLEGNNIDPLTHKGFLIASSSPEFHRQLLEILKTLEFGKDPVRGKIVFIGGFYGTGKSTLAIKLEEELGFERFNSDITRRDFNIESYDENDEDVVWGTIFWKIGKILQNKKGAILESTFLNEEQRKPDFDLANSKNADAIFIEVVCPELVTKDRIKSRPVSPDGIHVPTNRIEFYDKKKDLWEPVIPDLMRFGRDKISYLIFNSDKNTLHEGLVREEHRELVKKIADCLRVELLPRDDVLINNPFRYKIV